MKNRICIALLCAVGMNLSYAQVKKETIFFDYNSYSLNESAENSLNQLLQTLEKERIHSLKIIGHTDGDGSNTYNELLSKNRAKTVKSILTIGGVPSEKIKFEYKGEESPIASNFNATGKQQNRRVEVIVDYYPEFKIPESFKVQAKHFDINPNKDTILALDSIGSCLHIPKNSFIDKNGNTISEQVKLSYKEYRNSADMAFSGIKMTYWRGSQEYNFNSAGMFELQGFSNGSELEIADNKNLTLDYALAAKPNEIDFFKINENGNWEEIQEIEKNGGENDHIIPDISFRGGGEFIRAKFKKKRNLWKLKFKGEKIVELDGDEFNLDMLANNKDRRKGTLLGDGYGTDPGHTYPDIVKGLNVKSFGVYNCDQIYRLPNRANILAKYIDEKGNPIHAKVLSLIDLKFNGAFSFDPKRFVCNPSADNIIALFDQSGKIYVSEKGQLKAMDLKDNQSYTFTLKDMTNELKSSKDLADYLGIKI